MIGNAGEVGVQFVEGDFIDEVESKINNWLVGNKKLTVIDIRHQTMYQKDMSSLYHTALIIYKVYGEPEPFRDPLEVN